MNLIDIMDFIDRLRKGEKKREIRDRKEKTRERKREEKSEKRENE